MNVKKSQSSPEENVKFWFSWMVKDCGGWGGALPVLCLPHRLVFLLLHASSVPRCKDYIEYILNNDNNHSQLLIDLDILNKFTYWQSNSAKAKRIEVKRNKHCEFAWCQAEQMLLDMEAQKRKMCDFHKHFLILALVLVSFLFYYSILIWSHLLRDTYLVMCCMC